ncbi:hypothetical protein GCM10009789_36400 [Kribbella sancticallisti]|uniref:Uncharacterized protein n=1 Tax=Kribbella sancticallisti TaxID=460087 RepID=A0ABN2DLE9_9ACTN
MIVLGAVLIGLLMIPAGVAVGTAVRDASEDAAARRRALLTEMTALTLEDSASIPTGAGQVLSRVRVAWTDPGGVPREGWTLVTIGVKRGSEVAIWVDQQGVVVPPPRTAADSAALGSAAGVTAVLAGWMLMPFVTRLALVPLNRRRARDWEREWQQLDRRWRHPQD